MHGEMWFDGACQGNPGPMGAGAVVVADAKRTVVSAPLGVGTNNQAEYGGIIAGMQEALKRGVRTINIQGDSQLILRQLDGRYAVKAPLLVPLHQEAKRLLAQFDTFDLKWIPRAQNAGADEAARNALR